MPAQCAFLGCSQAVPYQELEGRQQCIEIQAAKYVIFITAGVFDVGIPLCLEEEDL